MIAKGWPAVVPQAVAEKTAAEVATRFLRNRPRILRRVKPGKRRTRRQVQHVFAERLKELVRASAFHAGVVEEAPAPNFGQAHDVGVEGDAQFFRESGEDGSRPNFLHEGAVHNRRLGRHDLHCDASFGDNAFGQGQGIFEREIRPDGLDLSLCVPFENVRERGLAAKPELRHASARFESGGMKHKLLKPAELEAVVGCGQVDALDGEGVLTGDLMAGDAGKAGPDFRSHKVFADSGLSLKEGRIQIGLGTAVRISNMPNKGGKIFEAEVWHSRFHVNAADVQGLGTEDAFEGGGLQFGADKVQRRRRFGFLSQVDVADGMKVFSGEFGIGAANAAAPMTGITVEHRQSFLDLLFRRAGLGKLAAGFQSGQHLPPLRFVESVIGQSPAHLLA